MTSRLKARAAGLLGPIKTHALPLLALLALTAIAYAEVPAHRILANWDDQIYITGNPAILGFSLPNLKLAFSSFYAGNYAPLPIVSFTLDHALWGMNPSGFLLANLSYHFLSGLL